MVMAWVHLTFPGEEALKMALKRTHRDPIFNSAILDRDGKDCEWRVGCFAMHINENISAGAQEEGGKYEVCLFQGALGYVARMDCGSNGTGETVWAEDAHF